MMNNIRMSEMCNTNICCMYLQLIFVLADLKSKQMLDKSQSTIDT